MNVSWIVKRQTQIKNSGVSYDLSSLYNECFVENFPLSNIFLFLGSREVILKKSVFDLVCSVIHNIRKIKIRYYLCSLEPKS